LKRVGGIVANIEEWEWGLKNRRKIEWKLVWFECGGWEFFELLQLIMQICVIVSKKFVRFYDVSKCRSIGNVVGINRSLAENSLYPSCSYPKALFENLVVSIITQLIQTST
jgi:hypothetical protein